MKTYFAKQNSVLKKWYVIDATDLVLGRMSVIIADILRGKNKPEYTAHIDTGDYVIIINADKVVMTSNKMTSKHLYWHTGYPGGIKSITPRAAIMRNRAELIIRRSVKGMLPSGPMGYEQLGKLKIYSSAVHPHMGQLPELLDVASMNLKNVKKNA